MTMHQTMSVQFTSPDVHCGAVFKEYIR